MSISARHNRATRLFSCLAWGGIIAFAALFWVVSPCQAFGEPTDTPPQAASSNDHPQADPCIQMEEFSEGDAFATTPVRKHLKFAVIGAPANTRVTASISGTGAAGLLCNATTIYQYLQSVTDPSAPLNSDFQSPDDYPAALPSCRGVVHVFGIPSTVGDVKVTLTAEVQGNKLTASKNFEVKPDPAAMPTTYTRLWGDGAEDTMKQIVREAFPSSSSVAILATNNGYWDALSAASLAGSYKAPILLTGRNALPKQTVAELKRLHVEKVYLCGGEHVVSKAVERELAKLDITVERYAGQWASDTANEIARHMPATTDTCFIATSWGYSDALSVASYAYAHHTPIFLTNYETGLLDESTVQLIKSQGFKHIYLIGGFLALPAEVDRQLGISSGVTVERLAGTTQYDTSALVANKMLSLGMTMNNFAIATAYSYEDALCGAPLCGLNNTVIILADDTNYSTIERVVKPHAKSIAHYYLLGGDSVVGSYPTYETKNILDSRELVKTHPDSDYAPLFKERS